MKDVSKDDTDREIPKEFNHQEYWKLESDHSIEDLMKDYEWA